MDHVVSVEATNYKQLFNQTGVFNFDISFENIKRLLKPKTGESRFGTWDRIPVIMVLGVLCSSCLSTILLMRLLVRMPPLTVAIRAVSMKAEEGVWNFNFSQSGSSAKKVGISGTVAVVNQTVYTSIAE